MALLRGKDYMLDPPKPERQKHKVTPIVGEFGRYAVDSHSMAKKGREGTYIVDVLEKEDTNAGTIVGTCACKGWSVRKTCSHLEDAREVHNQVVAAQAAEALGLQNLDELGPEGAQEQHQEREHDQTEDHPE
jgi:hypothetical protein